MSAKAFMESLVNQADVLMIVERCRKGMEAARDVGDPQGELEALDEMSMAYMVLGDRAQALHCLAQAQVLFAKIETRKADAVLAKTHAANPAQKATDVPGDRPFPKTLTSSFPPVVGLFNHAMR